MMRKFHTDQRSSLDHSTAITLMTMKSNSDDCCHDMIINTDLLSQCKKSHNKNTFQNLAKIMIFVIIIIASTHSFHFFIHRI